MTTMRTEEEMMNLIMGFAKQDERIRVVGIEGSRTNPNAPKDKLQDYDITFLVTEMASFKQSDDWLGHFGERLIMQKPEAMNLFEPELGNWFSYLMLFDDGNRIDLTLAPLDEINKYIEEYHGLIAILLDKDSRIINPPTLATTTDKHYHVKKPTAAQFDDCCNEFWWVSTYVVKGLQRKEFLFATEHLNSIVQAELLRMLSWQVGIETNFSLSVGKSYKYLERYVSKTVWQKLCSTYSNSNYEELWESLLTCYELFRGSSKTVAKELGCNYPDYDKKVSAYVQEFI